MSRAIAVLLLMAMSCLPADVERQAKKLDKPNNIRNNVDSQQLPHCISAKHLPNLVQVHPKVISGGLPDGDEAFEELQRLGVKTIISVDGMKPDVETASKFGIRYVHLPNGYDGVPDERVIKLAKAVRDLEGPIYFHCHHGKHRSPAAASVACVAAGFISNSKAVGVLELAGTNPNYRGLYESAREVMPLETALLDELKVDFFESVEVPLLTEAMVALCRTHDNLELISEGRWRSPVNRPDLNPVHEALLLREHFSELLRTDYVRNQPEEFRQYLRDSQAMSQQLEYALRAWALRPESTEPPEALQQAYVTISEDCATCHAKFRDVPLSQK